MASPKVALDKDGRRVRLRNLGYALEGSISGEENGKIFFERYRIEPNKWTTVHPKVYDLLKSKFDEPVRHEVPDWEPGGDNDRAHRTPRIDEDLEYTIEFGE